MHTRHHHMRTLSHVVTIITGLVPLSIACTPSEDAGTQGDVTVFEGARVIVGDGSPPIEDDELSPALYSAIIDEAHSHGLRVTAHVFALEDARGLLRAGVDAFAHGVRDRDVDDELIALWQERPNVVLVPNLPNPGVAVDLGWLSTVPDDVLQEMQEASIDRPEAQESFGIQARNLTRLDDAGVRIAFGTDGSTPWAVHLELEDMVRAGMTPDDVIVAATRNSADLLQLTDAGVIATGRSADFIVLDANPLDDITNTRQINAVYLRGTEVDRDALEARFTGRMAEGTSD